MRTLPRLPARAALRLRYLQAQMRGSSGIEVVNERLLRKTRGVELVLRQFNGRVNVPVEMHGPVVIHNADRDYRNLVIGRNAHVGRGCLLDLTDLLVIGDEATVSMGVTILTHQDVGPRPLAAEFPRKTAPTMIGSGAYIGANATILCGCSVGNQAVVGAGAVVTRPVPDGEVRVGVPARHLYDLSPVPAF